MLLKTFHSNEINFKMSGSLSIPFCVPNPIFPMELAMILYDSEVELKIDLMMYLVYCRRNTQLISIPSKIMVLLGN